MISGTPRSLGLKRLRLGFDWRTQNASSLHLVFRPDALSRKTSDGTVREADARSGVGSAADARGLGAYRPMPAIKTLDAYHVTIYPLSSFSTSVGVFEELAPLRQSYPAALDFGLRVQLPAKFAAVRVRWQDIRNEPALAASKATGRLLAEVYALNGDEDRVETYGPKTGSFDEAPVASDPFLGGATAVSYLASDDIELTAVGGLLDESGSSDSVDDGKRSNVFGQLAAVAHLFTSERFPTTFSLDLRTASEKWRSAGAGAVKLAPRTQRSAGLSVSTRVLPQGWLLFGAHLGKSQRSLPTKLQDQVATVSGWQVETGLLGSLGSDLTLQFMMSTERRVVDGSGEPGAFIDSDGGAHSNVRRYGLVLSYDLNEKA